MCVCVCVCTRVRMHVCACVCVHVCVHTYEELLRHAYVPCMCVQTGCVCSACINETETAGA